MLNYLSYLKTFKKIHELPKRDFQKRNHHLESHLERRQNP